MNHQIRRLSGVMALALIALLLNLANSQVFQSDWLRSRPDNTRGLLEEYGRERGAILVGNERVAESVRTAGRLVYQRHYTNGPLYAPATGYYSLVYGATGIERIYNDILSGRDDRLAVDRLQQLLAGKKPAGGLVTLTLDPRLQTAAYTALNNRTGAVVVLDAQTGAILTLVSSPSYDPNSLSSNNPTAIRDAYTQLNGDGAEPLSNRPYTMSLPPGSTFKLVVAAAALSSGKFSASSILPAPASLKLPNSTKRLHNWQGKKCEPSGTITLQRALEVSCNTAFAWLGMQLGADALRAQAEAFGFNDSVVTPLVSAASVFPAGLDGAQTAMSAIGQFDVRATAMQMAMVVAAISNHGALMAPQLIARVESSDYEPIEKFQSKLRNQSVSAEVANSLLQMLYSTVEKGTASAGQIAGVKVGAKTGTAESGTTAPPHAWFVATAKVGGRTLAIAVVVENGGGAAEVSGNRIAGPIAAAVIRAGQ